MMAQQYRNGQDRQNASSNNFPRPVYRLSKLRHSSTHSAFALRTTRVVRFLDPSLASDD